MYKSIALRKAPIKERKKHFLHLPNFRVSIEEILFCPQQDDMIFALIKFNFIWSPFGPFFQK
jgi:hypothetical protein